MPGSFRIGKIAGIEIDINVSWIIILVLLTVSLATGWFPQMYPGWSTATYWVVGLISSLLLFVSVLLHELAHSLVATPDGRSRCEPVARGAKRPPGRYREPRRDHALPGGAAQPWPERSRRRCSEKDV